MFDLLDWWAVMPPLTLAVLASVLQMQGADATITSDNKGVEDLLTAIRGQLQEQVDQNSPTIIEARNAKCAPAAGCGDYHKTYYAKSVPAKPANQGTSVRPESGKHR